MDVNIPEREREKEERIKMKAWYFVYLTTTISIFKVRDGSCLPLTSSDFLVNTKKIEEIEPSFKSFNGTMYSGLLPIDVVVDNSSSSNSSSNNDASDKEPRGKLSFWLFNPHETKDTLTIWLNGGPGCSSFSAGLFMEISPVTYPHKHAGHGRTSPNQSLVPNNYSWTDATNLLFIEQPIGVGFSYGTSRIDTEADLSRDFYNFLVNFFTTFPDMGDKPLYIIGESYAGMYAPSIAHYIHQQNKQGIMKHINLSGIGLGNGWIDAMTQGPAVIDYAYWHGMIDSPTQNRLWKEWKNCEKKMRMKSPYHDFTTPDECGMIENVMNLAGGNVFPKDEYYAPNQYDITTWDNYPVLNNPNSASTQFLNNPQVREELNFGNEGEHHWIGCIPGAGRRRLKQSKLLPGQILLAHDQPESVAPYIAELLDDAGIRVLIYAGDRDISVNLQGSEQVLNSMSWSGEKDWLDSERYLWMVDKDVAGYVKTHKNLDMLLVMNSGHLAPYNVPVPSLDLINRLTKGQSFGDILLPKMERSDESQESTDERKEGYYYYYHNQNEVHHVLPVILISISCFLIGLLIGSKRNKNQDYEKLP